MEAIGKITTTVLATAQATPTPSLPSLQPSGPPPLLEKLADYEIPARVWSSWKPAYGPREIVRALTPAERAAVHRRSYELECGLMPFLPPEIDLVDAALHGMFAGFRYLRQTGDVAAAAVQVSRVVLQDYPAWAIARCCLRIAQREATIKNDESEDIKLDPRWAPNDAQIADIVRGILVPYRAALTKAQALMAAPVQAPDPPRLTRAEIEAKLGRQISDRPFKSGLPPPEPGDGQHAMRVMAELAARRAARGNDAA